jgi:hypothetical protein
VRTSWLVERVPVRGAGSTVRFDRESIEEVLEDLVAARRTGDQLRFIAPWHATDEEMGALISGGAMPTFPGPGVSDVDEFFKDLVSKDLRKTGGVY